jgi:hypothetical protein
MEIIWCNIPFDVEGEFIMYTPAKLTADPYYSSEATGGYFEPTSIKYDNKEIINDLPDIVVDFISRIVESQQMP